jgi:hypothetical protein
MEDSVITSQPQVDLSQGQPKFTTDVLTGSVLQGPMKSLDFAPFLTFISASRMVTPIEAPAESVTETTDTLQTSDSDVESNSMRITPAMTSIFLSTTEQPSYPDISSGYIKLHSDSTAENPTYTRQAQSLDIQQTSIIPDMPLISGSSSSLWLEAIEKSIAVQTTPSAMHKHITSSTLNPPSDLPTTFSTLLPNTPRIDGLISITTTATKQCS